jgi:8-hydroxy-5-deazaflavin:NADPH oxidoreductase
MVVGILGAGRMGRTLARLLAGAGHNVRLANSRGPASLSDVVAELGSRAEAVAARDVAAGADVVVLATRWEQLPEATGAVPSWASEVVAALVSGARLVKAFNHQPIPALAAELGPRPTDRNALFLAGDDAEAKAVVAELMRSIGGAPVDTGDLRSGGALQASGGGPLAGHGRLLTPAEAAEILATAAR